MNRFFILFLIITISCKKEQNQIFEKNIIPSELNVFNNRDINDVIRNILEQNNDIENPISSINNAKFMGNELRKDSLILKKEYLIIKKEELDSLITNEDWKFIEKQLLDKRKYVINEKYYKQKILDSDSLKSENRKFLNKQNSIIDSLKKVDFENAKKYMAEKSQSEYYEYIKKSTPIVYIDKPLFTKNKKRVIFSFSTYSGPLSAYSEISIYEYQKNKWVKIKTLRELIS